MRINCSPLLSWRSAVTLAVLLLALPGIGYAQQSDPQLIYIQSWEKGKGRITEQVLNITLTPAQPENETTILDTSGKRQFKLSVLHYPQEGMRFEFWGVLLREILSQPGCAKESLGDNLIATQPPDPGRHFFPQEDLIGFLYPKEKPVYYIDGYHYPIMTKRVIRVEDFYLIIQVNNYQLNEKNPKKVDSLDLTIEFKNADDKGPPVVAAESVKP